METQDLAAAVKGQAADALADWASLWADLLHVDMTLHARAELTNDAEHLFVRRALWEAAVISYGRRANTGRRRQRLTELVEAEGAAAQACHRDVVAWRDRHVAHRVDRLRERVQVAAILDPAQARLKRIKTTDAQSQ